MSYVQKGDPYNFFHFNVDLSGGPCLPKRLSGCVIFLSVTGFYEILKILYNGVVRAGTVRKLPHAVCGAGHDYLAISPEGDLYPCHQFVGEEAYKVGTVDTGMEELIFHLVIFLQQCFFHLYADSGFQALFLQRAAFIVGLCETAAVTDIIGEGDLYPCHQFVGEEAYKVGTVDTGIVNYDLCRQFQQSNVLSKEACMRCWARYYCSKSPSGLIAR